MLSENEEEWFSHDIRCRYPRDMIVVYAQGYSMCDFLINEHKGGRAAFLKFVGLGMKNNNKNWEAAVQEVYGYKSVDELQETWIDHLRKPPLRVAARTKTPTEGTPTSKVRDTRTSSGNVPMLEAPAAVTRGAAPDEERTPRRVESKPTLKPDTAPPPLRSLLEPPEPPRLT